MFEQKVLELYWQKKEQEEIFSKGQEYMTEQIKVIKDMRVAMDAN